MGGRTEQHTIFTYQTSNTQFIDAPEDELVGPKDVELSNILWINIQPKQKLCILLDYICNIARWYKVLTIPHSTVPVPVITIVMMVIIIIMVIMVMRLFLNWCLHELYMLDLSNVPWIIRTAPMFVMCVWVTSVPYLTGQTPSINWLYLFKRKKYENFAWPPYCYFSFYKYYIYRSCIFSCKICFHTLS